MKKRILCTLLALVMLLALMPVTAGAANVKELDLADGNIYIFEDGYVQQTTHNTLATIKDWIKKGTRSLTPHQGAYHIKQSDTSSALSYYIALDAGQYDLTIEGLFIEKLSASAIMLSTGTTLNLQLKGKSEISSIGSGSSSGYTGIYVPEGATLNLFGNGTLEVKGADNFSAIGAGKNFSNLGTINIFGGAQVKAYGGANAPAIGGGNVDTSKTPKRGTISISGEGTYVYAESTFGECAIGSTNDMIAGADISITDGATVEAMGGIGERWDDTLKLDDTINLWSQARTYPALPDDVEYHSDRGIYLYYYQQPWISMTSLNEITDRFAYKILDYQNRRNWDGCTWSLRNDTNGGSILSVDGVDVRQDIQPISNERRIGDWALLKGQKTVTPTPPVQEPEQGNLLQNIVGSGLFFVPEDFPFYDVDSDDWFYESVKSAWTNELIDGVTARYFKPDNTLTVAQAIKLAAALHQKQSVGFVTLQNGGTHWYDNYVNYAVANGLIEAAYQSKAAETMNAAVTRAEFVHILSKLLNAGTINTVNSIPDVKSGDAYADEIFAFYRAGILTGSDRLGTFHPESSLKRSEAAAILVRLYDASQRQYITLK